MASFDDWRPAGQDGFVRGILLLAISLSALLWTVAARPAVVDVASGVPVHRSLGEGGSQTSAEARVVAADTEEPSQSQLKWLAQVHTIGIVTESIWKSSLVHADLGGTRSPRTVDISLAANSPDPPAAPAPPYLRHTPLLI